MHLPPLFEESRPEVLHALVRARPLATLVIATPDGLDAHHLPMILQAEDHGPVSLLGHAARANTLGEAARHEPRALAIFQGPAAYISPSWYPTKRIDGRVVPTWNYVVAHAHGRLRLHDDPDWVLRQADLLTRQQEHSREHPGRSTTPPRTTSGTSPARSSASNSSSTAGKANGRPARTSRPPTGSGRRRAWRRPGMPPRPTWPG